jgi:hypothetical protein
MGREVIESREDLSLKRRKDKGIREQIIDILVSGIMTDAGNVNIEERR